MKTKKAKTFNRESAIISCLKRTFSRSPIVIEKLKSNRREGKRYKDDGSVSKVKKVEYQCECCKNWVDSKNVQVDHIEPVVPINIPAKYLPFEVLQLRLFCSIGNLQCLCKDCHKTKSLEENRLRREWKKNSNQYAVIKRMNKVNGFFTIEIINMFNYIYDELFDYRILYVSDNHQLVSQYYQEQLSCLN
jgi:hypothetical protein